MTRYVIRTDAGYIGRETTTGPLVVVPLAFAYTYESRDDAERVASAHVSDTTARVVVSP